jgi:hypothetical protein
VLRGLVAATSLCLLGCPGPKSPTPPIGSSTLDIGRDGHGLRGVAGDAGTIYSALTSYPSAQTIIEARRDGKPAAAWTVPTDGTAGPLARAGSLLAVALSGTKQAGGTPLRGAPGALLLAVDASSGAVAWKLAIDANEWSVISSIAPFDDGFIVGGSFSGTLRATDHVVSSAGKLDGFVARVTAKGTVDWLIRLGGANADAVTGVATLGDRIAITGTFATGAELQGEPFVAFDDKSPAVDVFTAELDSKGTRKWSASFGGKLDDSSAGIAIDNRGRIAIAASVRDHLKIDVYDIRAAGPSDGLVVFYGKDGSVGAAISIGGEALDGLHAITATGDRIVVGGFFAGSLEVGSEILTASGDDAFLAAFDGIKVTGVWPVAGAGREEITALSSVPGGFIAGVAHTATAKVDGQPLAAPKDPASGAALVVRGVR